jgi:hypothetical protein
VLVTAMAYTPPLRRRDPGRIAAARLSKSSVQTTSKSLIGRYEERHCLRSREIFSEKTGVWDGVVFFDSRSENVRVGST